MTFFRMVPVPPVHFHLYFFSFLFGFLCLSPGGSLKFILYFIFIPSPQSLSSHPLPDGPSVPQINNSEIIFSAASPFSSLQFFSFISLYLTSTSFFSLSCLDSSPFFLFSFFSSIHAAATSLKISQDSEVYATPCINILGSFSEKKGKEEKNLHRIFELEFFRLPCTLRYEPFQWKVFDFFLNGIDQKFYFYSRKHVINFFSC